VTEIIAALGEQILDIQQRQWKTPYNITTKRMTSGDEWKYRNGFLALLILAG